ncbi:MAG TPA: hypothetical protein VK190_02965 [Pseudoneobacillus sp.]|nr:hypothetical protein [Pseudoneobacillus sp.]
MEQALTTALTNIGIALIGLLSAYLVILIHRAADRIKAEASAVKNEDQRKLINDAIDRVNDLASKAVAQTEQTIAADLRQAVKDGTATPEELKAIGSDVKAYVCGQLTDDVKTALSAQITDIDKYVSDTVEAALLRLKNQ